jgi:hypothetical protein
MNTKSKFSAKPLKKKFGSKLPGQQKGFPLPLLEDVLQKAFLEGSETEIEKTKSQTNEEWNQGAETK